MIVLRGFVYSHMLCVDCNDDVEPVLHSMASDSYLDLDCPKCERHLATLHRAGGPQLGMELNQAVGQAKYGKTWRGPDKRGNS